MAWTVEQSIEETVSLLGGDNSSANKLSGSHNDTVTTLTFTYDLAGISAGAELELDGDERVKVWSVNTGAKTAVVERGWAGTTAGTYSGDEIVRVSPVVFRSEIEREIKNAINQLSSAGLFQLGSSAGTYDYGTGLIDMSSETGVQSWFSILVDDGYTTLERFDFEEIGDGLLRPQFAPPTSSVTVTYRGRLTAPSSRSDDLVAVCGLSESAVDLPALAAAARLWMQVASKRAQVRAHSQHRRAEDVPDVTPARQAALFGEQLAKRITEEQRELRRQMPLRQQGVYVSRTYRGRVVREVGD